MQISGCSNKWVVPARFVEGLSFEPVVCCECPVGEQVPAFVLHVHSTCSAVLTALFELENLDFDDGNCGDYLVTV
jgi:hypothetical protein